MAREAECDSALRACMRGRARVQGWQPGSNKEPAHLAGPDNKP